MAVEHAWFHTTTYTLCFKHIEILNRLVPREQLNFHNRLVGYICMQIYIYNMYFFLITKRKTMHEKYETCLCGTI